MPQDYRDASYSNNTGLNGQVTPTVYATPGALTTVSSPSYLGQAGTAQITTQVNPFPGTMTSTNTQTEQQVAVVGPVYNSPGGILNKAPAQTGTVTTGGGP